VVHFLTNGRTGSGYLAGLGHGVAPGVIVTQGWWGLVDHIKDIVDRLAAVGFVALAPDLYDDQTTDSPDEAGRVMMAREVSSVEQDLGATVGTVGFCMSGQLSLYAVCINTQV
jgi:carboxymethylenebutenolidase